MNWLRIVVILIVGAAGWQVPILTRAGEEETAAYATEIGAFAALAPAEQRERIVGAYEHRLRQSANLKYEVDSVVKNQIHENGELKEVKWSGIRYVHRHYLLGNAYKLETDNFGAVEKARVVPRRTEGNFDRAVGSGVIVTELVSGEFAGRIDVQEDGLRFSNRYANWLDGPPNLQTTHHFRYVLDHQEEMRIAEIDRELGLIQLVIPWYPAHSPAKTLGEYRLWVDPLKGFLPRKIFARWAEGPNFWRSEEVEVFESRLAADVWMPSRLRYVIHSSSVDDPALAEVGELKLISIEQGTVKAADLAVEFPENTLVIDAIRGTTYRVGEQAAGEENDD